MRALIAFLLFLGISAAAVAAVIPFARTAGDQNDMAAMTIHTTTIMGGLDRTFRAVPGRYGSDPITDAYLIRSGIAPQATHATATELKNAFNGAIDVTGNGTSYILNQDNLPAEYCQRYILNMTRDRKVGSVKVAADIAGLAGATALTAPYTPQTAQAACSNETNAVGFEVG